MTPDERDRLVRLEQQYHELKGDVAEIKVDVKTLVNTYSMGQGAWKVIMRIGSIGVMAAMAIAWLTDHLPAWLHK